MISTSLLLFLNRFFPKPVHPFNLAASGGKSYGEWQYEKGAETLAYFVRVQSMEEILQGRDILDVGCGAGGKALFYAKAGARRVVGIDTVPSYAREANILAEKLGLSDKAVFLTADAVNTPFRDRSFDRIIANDFIEHIAGPKAWLREACRILRPGGRLYVNFPPYWHPFGAHLTDVIGIPWVHCFCSEKTLVEAYRHLVAGSPDAGHRLSLKIGRNDQNAECFTYINKMTIKRFKSIAKNAPLQLKHFFTVPLREVLSPLSHLLPEYFTRMVVAIWESPLDEEQNAS
ncbi:MAG: class I SAM-dependent methyltransferase [Peptococcaceae bacterium]|jgi:ubiquinone/menaquinone biosynthesis C-methylase UbiE|nr:MAG: class I SAM-dependent methyltransferase [Peptococcaceae bacterium]